MVVKIMQLKRNKAETYVMLFGSNTRYIYSKNEKSIKIAKFTLEDNSTRKKKSCHTHSKLIIIHDYSHPYNIISSNLLLIEGHGKAQHYAL